MRFLKPVNLPRLDEIGVDTHVILFTIAISLFSCLLSGLLPAWKCAGSQHSLALRVASRSAATTRERHRARNLLVIGQVSLALILLVTSGLMLRTFQEIRKVQPGFSSPEQVQVFSLAIPKSQVEQPERVIRILNNILERLAAIPGVSAAGLANSLPMDDTKNQNPVIAENASYELRQNPPMRTFKFVSPGFLTATGTRLIAGRDLTWTDIYNHHSVVLVSENLAKELWGDTEAALGKRVREVGDKVHWREVVGVVQNVHDDGAQRPAPPTVYWPFAIGNFSGQLLNVQRNVEFAVRSNAAGTEALMEQIRKAAGSVNSNLPLVRVRSLEQIYDQSMAQTSFTLVMLAVAGSMALILGVIGVYGVIAYAVAQRRAEIGIRIALGAQTAAIKAMFVRQGLSVTLVGIALGLAVAAGLARLMSFVLFGVTPFDPLTYGIMAAVLLIAGTAASYIPACRAAAADPMEALRAE